MAESTINKQVNTAALATMQTALINGANDAFGRTGEGAFNSRNEMMSKVVSDVCTQNLKHIAGSTIDSENIRKVFEKAATEAGNAFKDAFSSDGKKKDLTEAAATYKTAMNAAGGVADKYLVDLYPGMSKSAITSILQKATFDDVVDLTATRLAGTSAAAEKLRAMGESDIKAMLHELAKGDYFESNIDSMPIKGKAAFSAEEIGILDTATRLANATWMVGQVHRAAWEGTTDRINPTKREAFNPYELLMNVQFDRQSSGAKNKGLSDEEAVKLAVARVSFEVWKDVYQYQQLKRELSSDEQHKVDGELIQAIYKKDLDAVKKALDKGADINTSTDDYYERKPLTIATMTEATEIAEYLKSRGATK